MVVPDPLHTAASAPAEAVGRSLTVTTTVSLPIHPALSVTVTIYWVVTEGVAVGLAAVVELRPVAGAHEYERGAVPPDPVGDPPICTPDPRQTATSFPAEAVGPAAIETWIVSLPIHPLASVTITIYWVVEVGLAVGLATVAEERPVVGVQE